MTGTALLERPDTNTLTPAQVRTLDAAALHPELQGRAVVRDGDPADVVPLSTARKLVRLGLLEELDEHTFRLPHPKVPAKSPLSPQRWNTKRRARIKSRVARASRRLNRKSK